MSGQYIRKVGLFLSDSSGNVLDLSSFEIVFRTSQADAETPNVAHIRVFNLADSTVKQARQEFQKVRLQAGYKGGSYGTIFDGQIARFRSGRLDAKDSFLDIEAGDGDKAFQFAFVNKSLAAGSSPQDRANAIAQSMSSYGVTYDNKGNPVPGTGGILPRGKVLFGLAREQMGPIADTSNSTWSVQGGKLVIVPYTGYLSGEIVVLNSGTGLIGVPEATESGIEAETLLNPRIKIGTRVKIDNALINQTQINQQGFPRFTDINFVANTSTDGVYRVLVAEHHGDMRGRDWGTDIVCLAVDSSSPQESSVQPYGLANKAAAITIHPLSGG